MASCALSLRITLSLNLIMKVVPLCQWTVTLAGCLKKVVSGLQVMKCVCFFLQSWFLLARLRLFRQEMRRSSNFPCPWALRWTYWPGAQLRLCNLQSTLERFRFGRAWQLAGFLHVVSSSVALSSLSASFPNRFFQTDVLMNISILIKRISRLKFFSLRKSISTTRCPTWLPISDSLNWEVSHEYQLLLSWAGYFKYLFWSSGTV